MSKPVIQTVTPVFGDNYAPGYIGFTYTPGNFVSCGIAYFTRWSRMDNIKASHVLVVTGPNECVEALPEGVVVSDLAKYFESNKTQIFFRKPRGWTPSMGERIVTSAYRRVGKKYGYALIVGHAAANSVLGKVLSAITAGWSTKLALKLFNRKSTQVCSETVAEVLKEQPELNALGSLRQEAVYSTPDSLLYDDAIFEVWKDREDFAYA